MMKETVKDKVHPRTGHKGPEGEKRHSSTFCLTGVLIWRGWSEPCPGCFSPQERPGSHSVGG
jgi:hypothetical protein